MKKIYKNLENFTGFLPNFSYFFSSNVISYFFSFFIIVIFARTYSAELFGKFTIAQTIFFIIFSMSFSNIHYYLNKSLSLNFDKRRREIGSCFLITFYASVFLYVTLALFLTLINIDQDLKNLILILNLIIISEPFSIFYSELFVRGQFNVIFRIKFYQNLIFLVIKLFIILNKFDYLYLALAYFLENVFFSLIVIYYFKKNGNKFQNLIFSFEYTKKIIKKIILFPLLAFAFLISMRVDVLMISNILGVEQAGYYSATSRIITIILLFGTHFFQFIYPNLNRISYNREKFTNIYKNLIFLSILTGIITYLFALILGKSYLQLFGTEFLIVLNSLKILSINVAAALIINLWVHKQYVFSKYKQILFFQTSTIILNITLNYYLISFFGINGAALATSLAAILSFTIINITQPREFFIIFSSFSLIKQRRIAREILKTILVNRNPEKIEKIKD